MDRFELAVYRLAQQHALQRLLRTVGWPHFGVP